MKNIFLHYVFWSMIVCIIPASKIFAQSRPDSIITIPLVLDTTSEFGSPSSELIMATEDKYIIPDYITEEYEIRSIQFDGSQVYYQRYKAGIITKEKFHTLVENYVIDTVTMDQWSHYSTLNVLVVQEKDSGFLIIPDMNRDNNFKGEVAYRCKAKESVSFDDTIYLPYDNSTIAYTFKITIEVQPAGLPKFAEAAKYNCWFCITGLYKGKIAIGIDSFTIKVWRLGNEFYAGKNQVNLYVSEPNEDFIDIGNPHKFIPYKSKDRIPIGGNMYQIEDASLLKNELTLKFLSAEKPVTGVRQSEKMNHVLSGTNLLDGRDIDIDCTKESKYVLLHFWGTWCGPCMAALPSIKELHQKYGSLLTIVGVNMEQEYGSKKNLEPILKLGLNWPHIKQVQENPFRNMGIVELLKVVSFPTYFLLSQNEILLRTGDVKDVELFLKDGGR